MTFDLPIWLKAVNIIKQANLPVIPRLGGFHLLKSYLGSIGNIMKDSGLLDVIQLIYPGSTTASHIMDGGCFDKAIRAHLFIGAAIYQHIMKLAFTEDERGDMKSFMEKVADGKMGARHSDPVVRVFEQRFEETFKRLAKGGRTPALWVEYHHMVDVLKVFIRTERLADHNGHLSCIVTKMLHIFAAAGHHQYAKGARLYCQLMKELETLPAYKDTLERLTAHGNHVVRYSSHEWSGTWCDICIEQTLMKAARFCEWDAAEYIDIFLDKEATKETVIHAGTAIFKCIYHGRDTTLGEIRYNMFSRKAAAGVIKPETLPPTEGAAAQHSLRAYLQTRDWILLQSMSLSPSDYGWTIGVHGYEPVPTLDPMAPDELLQFTSCNCHGDCNNRRCSCKKNGVTRISACRVCKGITCKNGSHDDVESEEGIDNDC